VIDSNFPNREKTNWRSELKARLLAARRGDESGRELAEGRILQRLEQWLVSRPGLWLSFRGFSFEPRLSLGGLQAARSAAVNSVGYSFNCSFAYPKILPNQTLSFFRWTGSDQFESSDWETNRFGIQEPEIKNARSAWVKVEAKDSVVGALIPALGFDRQLFRLGRGRGFYDRFLASFDEQRKQVGENPIYKIGIGFSEQLVDELPLDDHDVKLDAVLTDREMIVGCTAVSYAD
jgi:5,10-methenyltetrahydrofolate synthetase